MVVLAALAVVPVRAQKVYVDYDRSVDFHSFRTFEFKNATEGSMAEESPFIDRTIEWTILDELKGAGLENTTSNPDLYVTYYGSSTQQVRFNTSNMGYWYGAGWFWDPYWGGYGGIGLGPATGPTMHIYERGTLIIDVWDAKTNEAIFRGTAEAKPKDDPNKFAKQVKKVVDKIGDRFESMYTAGK